MSQNASEYRSISVCDLGMKREGRSRGEKGNWELEDELVPKDTLQQRVAKE